MSKKEEVIVLEAKKQDERNLKPTDVQFEYEKVVK